MSGVERYLSPTLFAADFSNAFSITQTSESYRLTSASKIGFKEDWLQAAIVKNPELVLAACREGGLIGEEQWRYWAREVTVPDCSGSIDLLLVSESGRVGIVETKLAFNPGARREVVAQVLEYAINLSSIIPKLPEMPKIDSNKPFAHRDDVLDRIREGDYLLIIAGDQIDSRAVRLSEALLGKHLLRAWDLALVEVAVFEQVANATQKSYLLVPHIRGTIIPVRRQVVTIDIQGDRTRVEVTPATPAATGEGWDEERYFARAQGVSAPLRQFGEELRHLRDDYPNVSLAFGRGATPTLTLRKEGRGIVILYLDGAGSLTFNKPSFARALGEESGALYGKRLEELFPEEMRKDWAYIKLQPKTAERALSEVLAVLKEVLAKS